MGSGFKIKIFTKKFSALGPFGPWGGFLSLGHCLDNEKYRAPALMDGEFLFEDS
jgi:hypothetical protein